MSVHRLNYLFPTRMLPFAPVCVLAPVVLGSEHESTIIFSPMCLPKSSEKAVVSQIRHCAGRSRCVPWPHRACRSDISLAVVSGRQIRSHERRRPLPGAPTQQRLCQPAVFSIGRRESKAGGNAFGSHRQQQLAAIVPVSVAATLADSRLSPEQTPAPPTTAPHQRNGHTVQNLIGPEPHRAQHTHPTAVPPHLSGARVPQIGRGCAC